MAASEDSNLRMRKYMELLEKANKASSLADLLAVLKHMRRMKVCVSFSAFLQELHEVPCTDY
jgi:hypothetical protein